MVYLPNSFTSGVALAPLSVKGPNPELFLEIRQNINKTKQNMGKNTGWRTRSKFNDKNFQKKNTTNVLKCIHAVIGSLIPPNSKTFEKILEKLRSIQSQRSSVSPLSVCLYVAQCARHLLPWRVLGSLSPSSSQLGLVQFYQATHQPSHANILANPFWICQDWRNIEMPARRSLNSFEEETAELIYHGSL